MAQGYQAGLGSGGTLMDHGHVAAGDGGQVDPDTALVHQPVQGFGDGLDGNVVIAVNTTLTRDKSYNNLTVNGGVTLSTAGFVIRVRGTFLNNGTIGCSGGAGGAGAGIPTGTGGAGGIAPYYSVTPRDYIGHPHYGGGGGSVAESGVNNAAGGAAGGPVDTLYYPIHLRTGAGGGGGGAHGLAPAVGTVGGNVGSGFAGGAGGAGAGAGDEQLGGGGGGAGGGVVLIYAFIINNVGSILASGGAGGAGVDVGGTRSGNGGGGGGGSIIILYRTATLLGTRTVTGGAAGVGGNGGAAGAAGYSYAMQI